MTGENLAAIVVALITAYFGWKEFKNQHDLTKGSSTNEEWRKLYELAYNEKEEMKKQFEELQKEFYEMKTDSAIMRTEFNNIKKEMLEDKQGLQKELDELLNENKIIKDENIHLSELIGFYENEIENLENKLKKAAGD